MYYVPLQTHLPITEATLPRLQTVKIDYARAVDNQTHRLANRSTRYDYIVSRYITKILKKVKSKEKGTSSRSVTIY